MTSSDGAEAPSRRTCRSRSSTLASAARMAAAREACSRAGADDERRVVSQPERTEGVLEAAEELVGPGHLCVVGTARVARRVGLGRLVGVVRLVEVEPE